MPYLEVTTKVGCPHRCGYCPQDVFVHAYLKRSSETLMTFETFKACVDKLSKSVGIHFSGMCEPWSNPQCTRMVLYAHQAGHGVCVFTTGSGMSLADLEAIKEVPFQLFEMHLPDKDGVMRFDVTPGYLEVLRAISASGMRNVRFGAFGDIHPLVREALRDQIIKQKVIHSRSGNLSGVKTKRLKGAISCEKGLNCNVLLPNGDVIACCNDYGMKHVLGNLRSQTYEALFQGEEVARIKRGFLDPSVDIRCRYCHFAVKHGLGDRIRRRLARTLVLLRESLGG